MPVPYSAPRSALIYVIRINSDDPTEHQTPDAASKLVADNIYAGKSAKVTFQNAANLDTIRQNFNIRLDGHLRKLGHNTGFGYLPDTIGAEYRLK